MNIRSVTELVPTIILVPMSQPFLHHLAMQEFIWLVVAWQNPKNHMTKQKNSLEQKALLELNGGKIVLGKNQVKSLRLIDCGHPVGATGTRNDYAGCKKSIRI